MKRILVVEDDASIRDALRKVLKAFNYDVATAEEGEAALSFLKQDKDIDLIIADIMMPVMNGLDFRRNQLSDPLIRHIPVIFLSANNDFRDEITDLTPYEFLNKPIDIDDLRRILDNFFLMQP